MQELSGPACIQDLGRGRALLGTVSLIPGAYKMKQHKQYVSGPACIQDFGRCRALLGIG